MKPKDKYCTKCGALLNTTLISLGRFDGNTGKELFKLRYKCPTLKEGWFYSHSEYDDFYGSYDADYIIYYDKDGNEMGF